MTQAAIDPALAEGLSVDELNALIARLSADKERQKRKSRFALFRPFSWQMPFVECQKKVRIFIGGNQIGKTSLGAYVVVSAALGVRPPPAAGGKLPHKWVDNDCSGKRFLICGESLNVSIPKVIIPKLDEMITKDMQMRAPKKNQGSKLPEIYFLKTGAEIHIQSYNQDTDAFEGAVWDGVWFDEPPPEDVWTAVRRGTMAREGFMMVTATPIKEPWMFDSFVGPLRDPDSDLHETTAVFRAEIHQNCATCFPGDGALPHHEIMDYVSKISDPAMRAARERGEFVDLAGIEFGYVDRSTHVVGDLW